MAARHPIEAQTAPFSVASRFIQGRLADNAWIILCPLLALAALAAIWRFSGYSDLAVYAILFAFVVTGHHLPGWFRAFGEPAVYKRYRARLWTSLVAVPALIIVPTALGLGAVALTVGALFDLWHVAMQQHGFGRIYSAKAGDTGRNGARLDLACVLTWYATAVAWSDAWMMGIAHVFSRAGLSVLDAVSPSALHAVRLAFTIASAALAIAYLTRAMRLSREGISTPQKHLLHLVAFIVIAYSYQFASWYRANSVQNLFHAFQYFFMVWIFGHLSVRRDSTAPSPFYRRLFGAPAGMILFAAAIGLYGLGAMALSSSGYRLTGVDAERSAQVLGSIGLASLLLHFYVDSFIWKVRSREVRTALAIGRTTDPAAAPAFSPEPAWRGVAHAVAYFGIPLAAIGLLGARGRGVSPDPRSAQKTAELFPASALARYSNGMAKLNGGDRPGARRELESAVALAPSFEGPAMVLARMDQEQGDGRREERDLLLALAANPRDPIAHYGLGNRLAFDRRIEDARKEYEIALRISPNLAPVEENLGALYKWQGRMHEAVPHFERAHELDPNLPAATFDLAGALATLGQTPAALEVLDDYRRRHPGDATAASLDCAIRADAARTPSPNVRP